MDACVARKLLFICSRNRLRSPTAERVFAGYEGIETESAGLADDADNPLTPELLHWADLIVVMEKVHRRRLNARFAKHLAGKRIVCLDIPDNYAYMDPALIALLERKLKPLLPT